MTEQFLCLLRQKGVSFDEIDVGASESVKVGDVDDALKFLKGGGVEGNLNAIDEKKLLKKIDWTIMPLLFLTYYLQYTDKNLRKDSINAYH